MLSKIEYGTMSNGEDACSFRIASDRQGANGTVTAYVKVNVYLDGLVKICRTKLMKGIYVLVEGELMNRDGQFGDLTEVRARNITFIPRIEAGGATQ